MSFIKRMTVAATARTLKRDVKLKDGRTFPAGTAVTVNFLNEEASKRGQLCELVITDKDVVVHGAPAVHTWKTSISRLPDTVSGFTKPSVTTMTKWMNDGVAKTPTGKRTEPDGYGDDNSPSWLLALGLI